MKASDYIIDYLKKQNVERIYGYIGGMIVHLVDSIKKSSNIMMINTITEQGAAFAAEAEARYTGHISVAMATSGPGATNLITGIGSCYFDSVPVLFITGQVNTYEYKGKDPIRQRGFQETDIETMVKPITKYAKRITTPKNLRYELEKAIFISKTGRKGPVLLDIPMNVQREDLDFNEEKSFFNSQEYLSYTDKIIDENKLNQACELIKNSKRPLVLLGGGCNTLEIRKKINKFIAKNELPVVYSLLGKGVISDDYSLNFGLIGSYGNRYGNLALANCDTLLVLGARLDTRQTGTAPETFARFAKIIRVEIDNNELEYSKIKPIIEFNNDISLFLEKISNKVLKHDITLWKEKLSEFKKRYPSTQTLDKKIKKPNFFLDIISKYLKDDDIICLDVGQNQMWAAQSLKTKENNIVMSSGGMGAMGFALPASIGASLASKKRVIVITGDGGMQMNIQELEIIKRRELPIKIIVMNNACLGMVRQFQEIYFNGQCLGTLEDYSAPNFSKIAEAYQINASQISIDDEYKKTLNNMFSGDKSFLLNCCLDNKTTVEPKLIVGHPLEDMYPHLSSEELKANMSIKES